MLRPPLAAADLEHFADATANLAGELRGSRILVTGGTGFFGTSLVECFLHLNRRHSLGASLTIVTRDQDTFGRRSPHLAQDAALTLLPGDIESFPFPPGRFTHVIHAATDSVTAPGTSGEKQYSAIVEGTRRVLRFAGEAGAERLLLVSSGAVYGPQPRSVLHVCEDDCFQEDASAYTQGKRAAERLCLAADTARLGCVLARCFAFVGPHLPLRAHFAAGNFLADALDGLDISIRGDGTPLRSYMYSADLAVWLWTLLLRGGPTGAYNVGSEQAVSIRELAEHTVAAVNPRVKVHVAGQPPADNPPPARYVPSTRRACEELGLRTTIGLDEALRRTAAWYRQSRAAAQRAG